MRMYAPSLSCVSVSEKLSLYTCMSSGSGTIPYQTSYHVVPPQCIAAKLDCVSEAKFKFDNCQVV